MLKWHDKNIYILIEKDAVSVFHIKQKDSLHYKRNNLIFGFPYWFGWWQHGS